MCADNKRDGTVRNGSDDAAVSAIAGRGVDKVHFATQSFLCAISEQLVLCDFSGGAAVVGQHACGCAEQGPHLMPWLMTNDRCI